MKRRPWKKSIWRQKVSMLLACAVFCSLVLHVIPVQAESIFEGIFLTENESEEETGENTGENTGEDSGENTGEDTGENTGEDTGEDSGEDSGDDSGEESGEKASPSDADKKKAVDEEKVREKFEQESEKTRQLLNPEIYDPETYPDVRVYVGYRPFKEYAQEITQIPVSTIAENADTIAWYSFGRKENGEDDKGYDRLAMGMRVADFVDLSLDQAAEDEDLALETDLIDSAMSDGSMELGYEAHSDHLYKYINWGSLMQERYCYPSEGYTDRYLGDEPVEPIFSVIENYQYGKTPRMLFGMTDENDTETVGQYMVNSIGYVYLFLPLPELYITDSDGSSVDSLEIGVRSATTLRVEFDTPTKQLRGRLAKQVKYRCDSPYISVQYDTSSNKLKILGTAEGDYSVSLYLEGNEENAKMISVSVLTHVPETEDDFEAYETEVRHRSSDGEGEENQPESQDGGSSSEEGGGGDSGSGTQAETAAPSGNGGGTGGSSSGSGSGTAGISKTTGGPGVVSSGDSAGVQAGGPAAESAAAAAQPEETVPVTRDAVKETAEETQPETTPEETRVPETEAAEEMTVPQTEQETVAVVEQNRYQSIVMEERPSSEDDTKEEDREKTAENQGIENNLTYMKIVTGSSLSLLLVGILSKVFSFLKQIRP